MEELSDSALEEIEVLRSIFGPDTFSFDAAGRSGSLLAPADPAETAFSLSVAGDGGQEKRTVKYLPPIELRFQIPPRY